VYYFLVISVGWAYSILEAISLATPFLFKPCGSSASVVHFNPGWVGLMVWAQVGGGKQACSERQTCYSSCGLAAAQVRAIIHPITVHPKSKFRMKTRPLLSIH
jgi:hypothetical protein